MSTVIVKGQKGTRYGCWFCDITVCLPCFFGGFGRPAHYTVCPKTDPLGRGLAKLGDKCDVCGKELRAE